MTDDALLDRLADAVASRVRIPLDLARMVGHRDLRQLMVYYNESAEEIAGRLG